MTIAAQLEMTENLVRPVPASVIHGNKFGLNGILLKQLGNLPEIRRGRRSQTIERHNDGKTVRTDRFSCQLPFLVQLRHIWCNYIIF